MAAPDDLTRYAPLRKRLRGREAPACFLEHVFGLAEREADEVLPELLAREKRRPRDSGDADLRHEPTREQRVVVESERADVAEHVVRALRSVRSEARRFESAHQHVAARAVFARESQVIRTAQGERSRDRFL